MKISIHEPIPASAVSYYRSIGTFSYLSKINKNIQIEVPNQISWHSLIGTDIFYMERPQQDSDLQALKLAKDFNIPIWVDYDDLLHEIPSYNPSYDFYKKSHVLNNIEECMKLADVITVSTQKLKDYYSKFNKNIHVIENAFNDYQYKLEYKTQNNYKDVLISWRGSATHRNDLLSIADGLFKIDEKFIKEISSCFTGNDIWYITDKLKNKYYSLKEVDIIDFNKFIKNINSSIQLVPLVNNDFNIGKSNIGYIEATYMGAVTIAPDLPEFLVPGCINYNEKNNNFSYFLEKAIKSKKYRQDNYDKAHDYVSSNLFLSKINKKRLNIIEKLVGK